MTTVISDAILPVLACALADAVAYREPAGFCRDCNKSFEGRCADHIADQEMADSYRGAALVLGVRL
jgi:hypothetical protein